MSRGRLEAFSDGVIAILVTIMVLNLRPPSGDQFTDLRAMVPQLLVYVLSFVMLAIYWNNHHHLMQVVERIDGRVLWANMGLLFSLSLMPIATSGSARTGVPADPCSPTGWCCWRPPSPITS